MVEFAIKIFDKAKVASVNYQPKIDGLKARIYTSIRLTSISYGLYVIKFKNNNSRYTRINLAK